MIDIRVQARGIAAELGNGWSLDTAWPHRGAKIRRDADGAVLFIREGGYNQRGRIVISGTYPHRPGACSRPESKAEITVSASKEASRIAADITRRLLPGYLPNLARVQADNAEQDRLAAARRKLADDLCQAAGGARRLCPHPHGGARQVNHVIAASSGPRSSKAASFKSLSGE